MSATALQLTANRANALLSTGPRTAEGKEASARNAQSHGLTTRSALLPGEDSADYEAHHAEFLAMIRPQSALDHELVRELSDLRWRLRRVPAFEAMLLCTEARKLRTDDGRKHLVEGLESEDEILAVAFKCLVETKVLTNLYHHEARISRRAEKLEGKLVAARREIDVRGRLQSLDVECGTFAKPAKKQEEAQRVPETDSRCTPPCASPSIENRKIEPNVPYHKSPEPGRNELCPCGSGLKYKRCCLNKPRAAVQSAA